MSIPHIAKGIGLFIMVKGLGACFGIEENFDMHHISLYIPRHHVAWSASNTLVEGLCEPRLVLLGAGHKCLRGLHEERNLPPLGGLDGPADGNENDNGRAAHMSAGGGICTVWPCLIQAISQRPIGPPKASGYRNRHASTRFLAS
ncbi:hypothetical protein RJ639_013514 [Escallonia herrerae]|uniref:Uncharacterized protein n=1 Tax=Escallonia herrerae TaxID=1293975 RepID=A0AA89APR7_9ASTE|nr:hypothetical protein RJ639_013514 [Escallonia herrerae]